MVTVLPGLSIDIEQCRAAAHRPTHASADRYGGILDRHDLVPGAASMSRLIRRIFDRANQKFSPRARVARQSRTAAGLKARLLLQPLEERAVPTAYTVTSLADTGTGSGTSGDLRYCITQSNLTTGGNTIDMTGVTGTITLTTSLPNITEDVTITGPGPSNLTLNVNGTGRGFFQETPNFGVSGLTITGSVTSGSGGAIWVGADYNLTVTDAVISGNTSGGRGGAIYFDVNGSLAITNSSITHNSSGAGGGGVYFFGTATSYTISNSTIANNTGVNGAGLSFEAFSGTSTANIINSTITGNSASGTGGGINFDSGAGSITLDNTIVSGNTAGWGTDISDGNTAGVAATHSALGTTTGYTLNTNSSNNVIGGSLYLQPLSNVTGPAGTFPIVEIGFGSAAIDAGDSNFSGAADQLGHTRGSMGAGVDIGAVEKVPGPPGGVATGPTVTDANASTSNPYQFTVTYYADTTMDYSTINNNNAAISVTAPAGVTIGAVSFVSATPTSNAAAITATYQFTVAGGWTVADDGTYTVNVAANQVKDTGNNYVPAGPAGTFKVALAYTGANALVVTNTGDAGTGSGLQGDLRYVLTKAAAAASSSVPNQIVFSNSTAGGATDFTAGPNTITLGSALPAIPENVTITGPGRTLLTVARSASAGGFGIFNISGPTAQTVTISGMTVTGGSASTGGAIGMLDQTLTLTGMALTGNVAVTGGAVYSAGPATVNVTNSSVSGNSATTAGGFYLPVAATVTITGSTLNGNSAGFGGALHLNGHATVTITNSTLANNTAAYGGGIDAIYLPSPDQNPNISITSSTLSGNTASSRGGAIYFSGGGTFSLTTSTLANNSAGAGGAIYAFNESAAGMTLTSVTASGNQAGTGGVVVIDSGGGFTLDNSILAGNTATTGPNIAAAPGPLVSSTYDAIDDPTGFTYIAGTGDLSQANSTLAALHLGPLQLNNGGTTQTIGLLAGSSAINAGDPGLIGTTDQNGLSRPQGSGVDIGSVEHTPGGPFAQAAATNLTDTNASTSNPYQFTVTYYADTTMDYSTINNNNAAISVTAPAGVTIGAVSFVSATPTSNAAAITATYQFTVAGGWAPADDGTYTINLAANQVKDTGNNYVPARQVGSFTVALAYTGANALVVTNTGDAGVGSGYAGDLRYCMTLSANVVGTSVPNQIVFSNSTAGGNTNFYDGTAHTITVNSALPAIPDTVTITGPGQALLTVVRSAAAPSFGMLYINGTPGTTVSLTGFTISGGYTTSSATAAGINMLAQSVTLTNMGVTNNSSTTTVGGIGEYGNGSLTVTNSVISGNRGRFGGGVYVLHGTTSTTVITGCTISNNTSSGTSLSRGAGLNIQCHGSVTVTNSTISGNSAFFSGGGIALFAGNASLTISGSTLSGDTATRRGGAIYFTGTGALSITNSTIANNTASSTIGTAGGGALDTSFAGSSITLTSVTLTGNSAAGNGGAINFPSGNGSITMDNTIVSGNSAGGTGANIYSGTSQIVNASFSALGDTTGFTYVDNGNNLVGATLNLGPLTNVTGPNGTFAVVPLGVGSAAIDAGDPALGGSGQTDQLGTARPVGAGVDIGAVETPVTAPPPQVSSVVVGDGSAQRSEVRSITVTFDTAVTFVGGNSNAAAAFQLLHTVYDTTTFNTQVANLQTAVTTNGSGQTVVTITFTTTGNAASEVDPNSSANTYPSGPTTPSLGDGRFTLTVLASNVSGPGGALAGNGTTAGTNYVSSSTSGVNGYGDIYRLFGDATGNGIDDLNDLNAFRNTYNAGFTNPSYLAYMDYDNDGVIDLDDLAGFRAHYNHHV
jgi:predicted outer membrane repeat protein